MPAAKAKAFLVPERGELLLFVYDLPPLEGKVTVAVTQEPAGGVPQPTGPMVLAGS